MSSHLTNPNPEITALAEKTPDGMAHWAGTGPDGATCGVCKNLGYEYIVGVNPDDGTDRWRRRRSACAKFYRLTQRHGNVIEPKTPACKYFEKREQGA